MSRSPIDISVIVCTRNRAQSLERMLFSAVAMDIPPDLRWELVIVDNGGSDFTPEVAARFEGKLPLRLVREQTPGISHARNRGVAEASGDWICWTDDDVELDRAWLAAWWNAFRRYPDVLLFGGTIRPALEAGAPGWVRRNLEDWPLSAVTARRSPGRDAEVQLTDLPWGANCAIRTAEQRQWSYDPELGMCPGGRRSGEETDLFYRLLRRGGRGRWVPESVVRHHVPKSRQTLRYLFRYFRVAGETAAYLHAKRPLDNANETAGRRGMASRNSLTLRCTAAACVLLSALAFLPGLERIGIRAITRLGLCTGILGFRAAAGRPRLRLQQAGFIQ